MRALLGALVVLAVGWHSAVAAPTRKVLVLPIDGSVDPPVRARANASLQKLAANIEGTLTVGDTTFGETAAALGCDPETPACAESVRSTLGVDELVYGRATTAEGETTLVVRRVRGKSAWREGATKVGVEVTDEAVETELSPLFDVTPPAPVEPVPVEPVPVEPEPPVQAEQPRNMKGIFLLAGGGVSVLVGLILWANVSSSQDEIDAADPEDPGDFRNLEELEDRAQRNAIIGDVLVFGGVALAAWGGWTLWKDRDSGADATLTPTVTPTSAGVSIGGRW